MLILYYDNYIVGYVQIYGFVGLSPSNEILVLDPYNDEEENWGRGKSFFLTFNSPNQGLWNRNVRPSVCPSWATLELVA